MPRRREVPTREIIPDPIYGSTLVAKFINSLMRDGKKSTAEKVFYTSMDIIQEKMNEDPLKVFKQAVENVKPVLEVRSRRVGGATYQVPVEVNPKRRLSLSLRWILSAASSRPGKGYADKLSAEFMDAYNQRGSAIKKKEDTHKMAEANKAFAHYRW